MKRLSNSIRAKFTLIFISILCFSCITSLSIALLLNITYFGVKFKIDNIYELTLLFVTSFLCIIIGSVLMFFATKRISKPIKYISDSTKEIAKGNFDIKIHYKSEDEIGALANNFNLMVKELNNMEYLRKDFMNNVSHEFKTPISSIQGFVEIIKDRNLPREKFDEYTDIIIEETRRLSNLSSNILRLSKLDNQVIQNNKIKFSLDEQLRRTILLLEDQWTKKKLELEINLDKVNYMGDEELIEQIWVNLIGNAIKFSEAYGTIYISLKRTNEAVIVEVKDEGVGISEDNKRRIYEKFYQGDTSRSKEGNGLGLAIVKRIIEICKGNISFKSEIGQGTKFTVELPSSNERSEVIFS